MTSTLRKLLDQLKITNNKIYENLPTEKRRSTANDTLSRRRPQYALPKISLRQKVVLNDSKPRKQGRPRLYLATVIENTQNTFVVRIKYNVRNRTAQRLLRTGSKTADMTKTSNVVDLTSETRHTRSSLLRYNLGRTSSQDLVPLRPSKPERRQKSTPKASATPEIPDIEAVSFKPRKDPVSAEQRPFELPYKGVLPFPDCIINETDPTPDDKALFDKLLHEANEERKKAEQEIFQDNETNDSSKSVGLLKSQILKIQFRDYVIDTWYSSPYPEEYSRLKILYICEHCLKYMRSPISYERHQLKNCNLSNSHPPGVEIYRDQESHVAVWEVDGRKNIEYCQNLCLLAKLFLNSKTLYYDVEPFTFYVLTEVDEHDPSLYHFVGYFSKEKLNNSDYNVSCILTLPIYQRKGYGNFLIDFSYLLSRNEFKFGTPEKPLSDLGLLSYRNYWKIAVARTLKFLYEKYLERGEEIVLSLEVLSKLTGMIPSDIVVGLEQLEALIKNPETGEFAIAINLPKINEVVAKFELKKYVTLKPELILWKPMIFGPSGGINSAPLSMTHNVPAIEQLLSTSGQPIVPVNNSISMISEFLKDDINNPFSYEEEAQKEIEHFSNNQLKEAGSLPEIDINLYVVCHPDIIKGIPMKRTSASEADQGVKEADEMEIFGDEAPSEDDVSRDPEFDTGSEVALEDVDDDEGDDIEADDDADEEEAPIDESDNDSEELVEQPITPRINGSHRVRPTRSRSRNNVIENDASASESEQTDNSKSLQRELRSGKVNAIGAKPRVRLSWKAVLDNQTPRQRSARFLRNGTKIPMSPEQTRRLRSAIQNGMSRIASADTISPLRRSSRRK
uniref:Histone acetyltransferase n=1 Tax=Candidozyma auris TaxID=498019 RepID=A0A0L0NPL3_CANAR